MENTPLKLITEIVWDEVETLSEEIMSPSGQKNKDWYVTGIVLQGNLKNKNGRWYPVDLLEREVIRYNKDFISQNRALGELGHPEGPKINEDRVSHMFVDLHRDGNNFVGKAKVLQKQDNGRRVAGFLEEGVKLGISSRGMGSVRNVNGMDTVQNDYFLATAGDIVLDPSAPDAFVRGIYEMKEWVWESDGILHEHVIADYKRTLDIAGNNLEQAKLDVFQDFMAKFTKN